MPTATTTPPTGTREPRLVDDATFVATRDAVIVRNGEFEEIKARWDAAQKKKQQNSNAVTVAEGFAEERALREPYLLAEARVKDARQEHERARTIALGPIAAWHRDQIRAANDPLVNDLRRILVGAWADRERALAAASAAGVQRGSQGLEPLALLEMFFQVFDTAESNLRRSDFLS